MQQSENGVDTVHLMDVLNSIQLDTFNQCTGTIDGITYDIAKVSDNVFLIINGGAWQPTVYNNIKQMESLMFRDGLDSIDLNVSVPYMGIGYQLLIKISKYKAPDMLMLGAGEMQAPLDTVPARGRPGRKPRG